MSAMSFTVDDMAAIVELATELNSIYASNTSRAARIHTAEVVLNGVFVGTLRFETEHQRDGGHSRYVFDAEIADKPVLDEPETHGRNGIGAR